MSYRIPIVWMLSSQCFPMYWYEENRQTEMTLFDGPNSNRYIRHDGITDWMLHHVQELYRTKNVTWEMIFYYVYGLLHTLRLSRGLWDRPAKSLPRLPLPDDVNLFMDIYKGGPAAGAAPSRLRAGARLPWCGYRYRHPPTPTSLPPPLRSVRCRHRSRLCPLPRHQDEVSGQGPRDTIIYNSHITLVGIPDDAYPSVVNGKSAIDWLLERYCVSTDKASGIRNDANDWAREHHQPRYILNLLLQCHQRQSPFGAARQFPAPLFVSADGVKWEEEWSKNEKFKMNDFLFFPLSFWTIG